MHLVWTAGGEADVVALDGDRITVASTTPSAPGSRPSGRLPSGNAVRLKVARCRRLDDGRFAIDGRLLDAPKALRAEIAALVPTSFS